MTRGLPFEKGNKFGRGRPRGSLNKRTLAAQKLFAEHSSKIMALAISKCPEDRQLLRMFARRIVPRTPELPVFIGNFPMSTIEELEHASAVMLKKVAAGKIAISEAQGVFTMMETRRRVLETQDLERRLSALEDVDGFPHPRPTS
jgi:hypothetical protein